MRSKKGRISVILALDVIGFFVLLVGAGLVRYGRDEVIAILGGFVMACGVAVLSVSRLFQK